jgi:RNA polymerase sigma-70 factor (ECF subfamily)
MLAEPQRILIMDTSRTTDDRPADGAIAERVALERFATRHAQTIFGFAIRLGLTQTEAEDCLQETLTRLWTELVAGHTLHDPRAWAFRTAYRIAMDEHRLRRRVAGLLARIPSREGAHAEPDPGAASAQASVWLEVDRLPVRQRQVVYLRYRADLSFDQIGSILGISAGAARSHATFAMKTLRTRLAVDAGQGHR